MSSQTWAVTSHMRHANTTRWFLTTPGSKPGCNGPSSLQNKYVGAPHCVTLEQGEEPFLALLRLQAPATAGVCGEEPWAGSSALLGSSCLLSENQKRRPARSLNKEAQRDLFWGSKAAPRWALAKVTPPAAGSHSLRSPLQLGDSLHPYPQLSTPFGEGQRGPRLRIPA